MKAFTSQIRCAPYGFYAYGEYIDRRLLRPETMTTLKYPLIV
jgi:hypothetical protein